MREEEEERRIQKSKEHNFLFSQFGELRNFLIKNLMMFPLMVISRES